MQLKGKKLVGLALVAVLIIGGVMMISGGDEEEETTQSTDTSEVVQETQSNVVGIAQSSDDFTTLVTAVVQEGLVETLSGDGPFTVFAPTNDAFASLLSELDITVEELLARDDLASILTYHVVPAEAFAKDLSDGQELTTVQGEVLTVTLSDGGATLTDQNNRTVNIVSTDLDASNGVVHVIDGVLLPTL